MILPLFQMKAQDLSFQDLALQPVNSTNDLYKGQKAHPTPLPENGYNAVLYLYDALILVTMYYQVKMGRVAQLIQSMGFLL